MLVARATSIKRLELMMNKVSVVVRNRSHMQFTVFDAVIKSYTDSPGAQTVLVWEIEKEAFLAALKLQCNQGRLNVVINGDGGGVDILPPEDEDDGSNNGTDKPDQTPDEDVAIPEPDEPEAVATVASKRKAKAKPTTRTRRKPTPTKGKE
ncbi:hypothetical protein [Thaumasiovibrio sp. DFM-14]|uniref:hypothetical protein n=1 Tax=Thaumasiovibrio sp. DFM-14 TaxID=3384792 RepID=UPI0039A04DB0